MKKHIKLLSMLMIVMMVCTLVSNVFASDLGYIEATLDKTVALEGNTVTLTIKALKPVTDYELRVTPTGEGMFEVTSKLQSSVANSSGNTRVLYMIQLAAQADKTVYPAGTELAKLTYTIPDGFYASNKDANDVAELGVNIAIKITDNGTNQSYTLTNTVNVKEAIYGDVNCDGIVDLLDALRLTKYLEDATATPLDKQALKNADVNCDGNVNGEDVLLIRMYTAAYFEDTLPEKPITDYVLYGDADRNGNIGTMDIAMLLKHINSEEVLEGQALKNADVNNDENIDMQDVKLIAMYITDWFPGTLPEKPIIDYVLYGDANCDSIADTADALAITKHISGEKTLEGQALKNADVNSDGKIDNIDVVLLQGFSVEYYPDTLPERPITDYVLYGDVSCDGNVNTMDASMLWRYLLGIYNVELDEQALKNADVDANGKVDYVDVELIARGIGGDYYIEQLPYEAIKNHKLHEYNNELVYELNTNNEATVVFWPDETKTKYFLPEKLDNYTVVGVKDFPNLEGITIVLPSTIEHIGGANEGSTIVTAKRITVVENYANKKSLTYIVASEILQERLTEITLENNVVGDYTTLSEVEVTAGLKIVVKNIAGEVLTNDDVMGTGTKLQIVDANNNVICEETVSFNGEINGDGVIDFFDVVDLISLVYDMPEGYVWNETVRSAAKFGAEGEVDFFDITTLISHIYDNN